MPSNTSGPVAQLGARFHGMEEVVGSIPTRSTNISATIPAQSGPNPAPVVVAIHEPPFLFARMNASVLCQPIPGAATFAVHYQVAFFQKPAEVLLERVPTRAGQCNYLADSDAPVFTRIVEDRHGQFGYGR